jgi:hypothetical protein
MKATIKYTLSESAQREQMAATGQPVAREQQYEQEITADELPLMAVADDGTATLSVGGSAFRAELQAAGALDNDRLSCGYTRLLHPQPDIIALIRAGQSILTSQRMASTAAVDAEEDRLLADPASRVTDHISIRIGGTEWSRKLANCRPAARAEFERRNAADLAARASAEAERQAADLRRMTEAADAFRADPTLRADKCDSAPAYWVRLPHPDGGFVRVHKDLYGNAATAALGVETIERQARYDQARTARADQLRAAWITAHGSDLLRANLAHGLGCRNTYRAERLAHEAPGWLFTSSPPAGEDRALKCASLDQLAAYDTIVAGLSQATRPAGAEVLGEPGEHKPVPIIRDLHLVWRVDIERIHTEVDCDDDACEDDDHWEDQEVTNGRVMAAAVLTSLVTDIMIAL